MLKVVLIGFGGIARLHQYAYQYHSCAGLPVTLVAACDVNPEMFSKSIAINLAIPDDLPPSPPVAEYTDWRQMLEEQRPDLVDICLPTRFHEAVTVEALQKGYYVLCEKPMANDIASCQRMLKAAAPGQLMIAQCVRFYPQYEYLCRAVRENRYGNVTGACFRRVTPLPNWGNSNWRATDARTGSCLMELNIHDIDVMHYIFGYPCKVSCRLESRVTPYDRSFARFYYNDMEVQVHSEWQDDRGHFCMSYQVDFTDGVLSFDGEDVFFTDRNGHRLDIELSGNDGVVGEIGYFVRLLLEGKPNTVNPPEQSAHTIYLLEQCFKSHEHDGRILELEATCEP